RHRALPAHQNPATRSTARNAARPRIGLRRAPPVGAADAAAFLAAYVGVPPCAAVLRTPGDVRGARDRGDGEVLNGALKRRGPQEFRFVISRFLRVPCVLCGEK